MNLFSKRKRYGSMDEEVLRDMLNALRENAHFKNFVEHLHERRETIIKAMQTERSINSSNRHFMESGKLEALDELLDDLDMWWRNLLD